MSGLEELDAWMLLKWQSMLLHPISDIVFPFLRNMKTWIPLYILLGGYWLWKFRLKGFWLLLMAFLTVGLADFLSAQLLKDLFARPRPCQEEIEGLRVLVNCSPHYSMPSSHAFNHFALSSLIFFTASLPRKWMLWLFWFWAAAIALAQVYVGVHYPFDVLAGGLGGSFLGLISARIHNTYNNLTT